MSKINSPLTWDSIPDEPINTPTAPAPAPLPSNVMVLPVLNAESMAPPSDKSKSAEKSKGRRHKEGLTDLECAEALIQKGFGGRGNVLFDGSFVYAWSKKAGFWRRVTDWDLRQKIVELKISPDATGGRLNSIVTFVKAATLKPGFKFRFDRPTINCLNGELHLNNDGVFVLLPHQKENYHCTVVPVAYNTRAECPRFERFLNQITEGDPDQETKIFLLYQVIGYALLSISSFEKFFIITGAGANGKSVFLKIMREIIGPANTASVQFSQFDNRFQRAHLQGKLLNLITELPEGGQIPDAILKAIVSGETITCENKGLPPFELTPFCTIIAATNHLPHTRDFSEALFRRAIIIRFNRVFSEAEQDRFLFERIKDELPGIFFRAVKSLEDLFRDNGFVEPRESKEIKNEWRIDTDQSAQFVADCCQITTGSIESGRLYQYYKAWADGNGVKQLLTQRGLTARLKRMGVVLSRGAAGIRLLHGIVYTGPE